MNMTKNPIQYMIIPIQNTGELKCKGANIIIAIIVSENGFPIPERIYSRFDQPATL